MNSITLFQPEGLQNNPNTAHVISTEVSTTLLPQADQPEKKDRVVNEDCVPMSTSLLFNQPTGFTNPASSESSVENVSTNLNSFGLDIFEQQQYTTENQLDGFLLHQLTQNDMDILLSLSLAPELATVKDSNSVFDSTTELPLEYYPSNKEAHSYVENACGGSTGNDPASKNVLGQEDSPYFDPAFLQNMSKLINENHVYQESNKQVNLGETQQQGGPINDESNSFRPFETKMHGLNQTERVCLWANCGEVLKDLQALISHLSEIHTGKGKATYRCEWKDCPRIDNPFTKRHKMHAHLRIHTGERPFVCPESGCKKQFTRPDSLSNHIKTHSKVRPFLCKWKGCGKAYFYSRSLKKHEITHKVPEHTERPPTEQLYMQPNLFSENTNPMFAPVYQSLLEFLNSYCNYTV